MPRCTTRSACSCGCGCAPFASMPTIVVRTDRSRPQAASGSTAHCTGRSSVAMRPRCAADSRRRRRQSRQPLRRRAAVARVRPRKCGDHRAAAAGRRRREHGAAGRRNVPDDGSRHRQSPRVKALLVRGANVNAGKVGKARRRSCGRRPRAIAVVDALIEAGADVHARSKGGFTPLLFAVRQGSVPAVRSLVKAKANVNESRKPRPSRRTRRPDLSTDATSALAWPSSTRIRRRRLLVENGADPNAPDARGSMLHALAWMRRPGAAGATGAAIVERQSQQPGSSRSAAEARRESERANRLEGDPVRSRRRRSEEPAEHPRGPRLHQPGRRNAVLPGGEERRRRADARAGQHGADPRLTTVQNVTPFMAAAGLGTWAGETPGPLNGTPEARGSRPSSWRSHSATTSMRSPISATSPSSAIRSSCLRATRRISNSCRRPRWATCAGAEARRCTARRPSDQQSIIRYLVDNGAKLDARNKLGWTPLMIAEGGQFGATVKEFPDAAALIRKLMSERGMDLSNTARPARDAWPRGGTRRFGD